MKLRFLFAVAALFAPGLGSSAARGEALRTLEGRWIRIVTDLPSAAATDDLAASVDTAVPQWIRFWQRPQDSVDRWQVTIYVMGDREEFRRQGHLPADLPEFPHGYQRGDQAWVVAQPSDYFTRHLVLHEAFHAFAFHVFGGVGAPWFAEGTAEMMATHKGQGASLRVPTIPADRESVPYWGRFKLIAQRREQHLLPTLETVLQQPQGIVKEVEPYVWSWTAVVLMTMYPEYRQQLTAATSRAADGSFRFTRTLQDQLDEQWPIVRGRWQLLLEEFDYGYDIGRNRVDWDLQQPLWDLQPKSISIAAARGWQSAGVRVAAGTEITVTASGRYSLGTEPRAWVCEPQGVTVRYHGGRPLGMVLAALVPQRQTAASRLEPLQIEAIGRRAAFRVQQDSWLLFRIGDDPSELSDNSGGTTIRIQATE